MTQYSSYFGLIGLTLIVVGLAIYSIHSVLSTLPLVLLILGLILVISWIIINFSVLKTALTSRSAKFGTNSVVSIVLFIGILILLNMVFFRFNWRIDTTAAKQFSLAEQTRKILENLDKEVEIVSFFKSGEEATIKELLIEYSHFSNRLKYQIIDPDRKPGLAKSYEIDYYGTIVIRCGSKQEKINKAAEEDLTNAIIKVTREQDKKIYFTTGHGEHDYDETGEQGMQAAKKVIENENYQLEKILLAEKQIIPEDCSALVLAGPATDLLENEQALVDQYLKSGGKVLFLLDPESPDNYARYLKDWGVRIGKDLVIDASGIGQLFGAGPAIPLVQDYDKNHAITKDFRIMTFFRQARSVTPADPAPAEMEVIALLKTNPNSWGETDLKTEFSFNPSTDLKGPVSLAAVVTADVKSEPSDTSRPGKAVPKKTRLVIFGDSDFATNSFFNVQGNGNLFMNALSWLAEEEDLISVRPRDPEDRRINLTSSQQRMMLWTGVILFPVLIFALGIYVYQKRR